MLCSALELQGFFPLKGNRLKVGCIGYIESESQIAGVLQVLRWVVFLIPPVSTFAR